MYADDTHITYATAELHSVQSSLNRDLGNIHAQMASLQQTYSEYV